MRRVNVRVNTGCSVARAADPVLVAVLLTATRRMRPESQGFFDEIWHGVAVGLIITAILGAVAWWRRKWLWPRVAGLIERLRMRWDAPRIWAELMISLDYATHPRDVMRKFWRAQAEPGRVRERIRQDVLEPIRDLLPTFPGDRVKVVWLRPTPDGKELQMYQQVGHSPEGQAALRLAVGVGAAGRAFANKETVFIRDIAKDDEYQKVEGGQEYGSALCAPIVRGTEVTGVLSVLVTREDAFWISERRYIEAMAAAIGALETLEEGSGEGGANPPPSGALG